MSYIEKLIDTINATHPRLGELVAICQISVKARKFLLIVSPSGCGKSRAMEHIARDTPDAFVRGTMTVAGLATVVDKMTGFRSVIVIDDVANINTVYMRIATLNTISGLCYTHYVAPLSFGFDYEITDFYGAAIVGIQPVVLRDIMSDPVWDASIQDKVLRYYHLYRPVSPKISLSDFRLDYGISFDSVAIYEPDTNNKLWQSLVKLGFSQWSIARTKEHLIDLLRAIAALEHRTSVIDDDLMLLLRLLRPMALEAISVTKEDLESPRLLNNSLLALLTEYYTYGGQFSLAQISTDYKGTLQWAYQIMARQNGYWQQISKSPTKYAASKQLIDILKSNELEIKK